VISPRLPISWYGFGVALEPHNLMYCFSASSSELVGVFRAWGLYDISILLPLNIWPCIRARDPMLSGVYSAPVWRAICSIL